MKSPEEMDAEVRESWKARISAVTKDSVNEKDREGRAWLSNAIVWLPDVDVIQHLLELGADVNAADQRRWTALHFAAQERHVEIARLLLQHGALVDPTDKFGNTPLGNATYGQAGQEVMRLLMEAGADPSLKNEYGISPLDLARQTGDAEKLSILENAPQTHETQAGERSEPLAEANEPAAQEDHSVSAESEAIHSPEQEEPLAVAVAEQAASEDFFEIPHVHEQEEKLPEAEDDGQPLADSQSPVFEDEVQASVPEEDHQPHIVAKDADNEAEHEPAATDEDELLSAPSADPFIQEEFEPSAPEEADQHLSFAPELVVEEIPEPAVREFVAETHIDEQEREPSLPEPASQKAITEAPAIEMNEPLEVAKPSVEQEPHAPFMKFQQAFHLDPDGGQRAPITASMPNVGLKELLTRFAGASFNNGLYRIIDAHTVVAANNFIAKAYPEEIGKQCAFAFDWLGNIYSVDPMDAKGRVMLFVVCTSQVIRAPFGIEEFHDVHLAENPDEGLPQSRHSDWIAAGNPGPTYSECIEFNTPLFFGGQDGIESMHSTQLTMYWNVMGQMIHKMRTLPPGQEIGEVTVNERTGEVTFGGRTFTG